MLKLAVAPKTSPIMVQFQTASLINTWLQTVDNEMLKVELLPTKLGNFRNMTFPIGCSKLRSSLITPVASELDVISEPKVDSDV
jgi:hypothetical protein